MGRRIGRWTYNSDSTRYGEAGWHLDGGPVVIDFMPGNHQCCNGGRNCCRGCYLLLGWPGREWEPVARELRYAMEIVEEWTGPTREEAAQLEPGTLLGKEAPADGK